MTGSFTSTQLIVGFTALTAAILLVAAVVGWRLAIRRMASWVPTEIAWRRTAMTTFADTLSRGDLDAEQAERLRANYRFHRAAIIALDPRSDFGDDLSVADAATGVVQVAGHRAAA